MKFLLIYFYLLCVGLNVNLIYGQTITTVAGGATGHGGFWGEGGQATDAQLSNANSVVIDADGNIYISDNERVLKVNAATGIITTIAGTGVLGYNGDNILATVAQLNGASFSALDQSGNLYIADAGNNRIRKINMTTKIITTVVGTGVFGSSGDGGPATAAEIIAGGVAWDDLGNFYVGDYDKVRKVDSHGIITAIAGDGLPGITGDGVPATATHIGSPNGVATDRAGNVYFADSTESIRKITISTGLITRVAGTGDNIGGPYSGDGIPATTCHISPVGLYVNDTGVIYITDCGANNRIEKVDAFGIIRTIAGTGTGGYSGDGLLATSAELWDPEGVAFDACGNMYIADFNNKRIRKVAYPPKLTVPSISLSGVITEPIGTLVTLTATVINAGSSYIIHWMNHGIEFTTTTVPSVTYTKAAGIDTITARVVSASTLMCYDSTTSAGHIVTTMMEGVGLPGKLTMTVYPNPMDNVLHVDGLQGAASYRLLNMVGSVMREGALDAGRNSVSVAALPQGVYMLEVNSGAGERIVSRILKE